MVNPFSIRWPFYLSWRIHGVTHSVCAGNVESLLKLFFAISKKYKGVKITYFPLEEKEITLFRRFKPWKKKKK